MRLSFQTGPVPLSEALSPSEPVDMSVESDWEQRFMRRFSEQFRLSELGRMGVMVDLDPRGCQGLPNWCHSVWAAFQ